MRLVYKAFDAEKMASPRGLEPVMLLLNFSINPVKPRFLMGYGGIK